MFSLYGVRLLYHYHQLLIEIERKNTLWLKSLDHFYHYNCFFGPQILNSANFFLKCIVLTCNCPEVGLCGMPRPPDLCHTKITVLIKPSYLASKNWVPPSTYLCDVTRLVTSTGEGWFQIFPNFKLIFSLLKLFLSFE